MGLFKRNKFKKLERSEVVNAICELEKQENDIEEGIVNKTREIEALLAKGRTEKNRDLQLFYAKKINNLKEEKEQDIKKGMYLLYNKSLMRKLKDAIDDNSFFQNSGKVSINQLLMDQKGLATFLNKALNTRVAAEDVLTSADDTFKEVASLYEENNQIYGHSESDDSLLSMFETEEQLTQEAEMMNGQEEDLMNSNKNTLD